MTMSFLSYITFGELYVKFGIFHFIAVAVFLTMPIVGSKWLSLATSAIIGLLYTITHSKKYDNTPRKHAITHQYFALFQEYTTLDLVVWIIFQ